jgi:superfamily I DNA and/or RNA helicase
MYIYTRKLLQISMFIKIKFFIGNAIIKKNLENIDVLIVDEAAQSLEVELLIPLYTCPRNMILIGTLMN